MRNPSLIATLLAAGCLAAGSTPDAEPGATPADPPPPGVQGMRPDRSDPLPPPAPAGAPERAEAEAALADGSNAALILFLARHPDDASAPRIRAALAARRTPDDPAQGRAAAGGEAGVIAAFDAARLAGTPEAWQGFARRHPNHPLTAEAARWR
ncbi:hypothetical protein [Paracoccus endophyticus]|uniref:hypothetical protein n=1 Tax=Paracoccus endophyticus TaxID=2233774 RepID=UPI000DD83EA1|nr:hypothetical protein [Paracoccus endophyticus]